MTEDELRARLAEHYSYARKLTAEEVGELLKLRLEYTYLQGPTGIVYRGLYNLTAEQVEEVRAASASSAADISWTTSESAAWRFARAEWTSEDRKPGHFAVVLVAQANDRMLLDAAHTSKLAGVGDWYHNTWGETLALAIQTEAETVTDTPLEILDVKVEENPADIQISNKAKRLAKHLHPHASTIMPKSLKTPTTKTAPKPTAQATPQKKGIAEGDLEAGVHYHAWDDDELATAVDGAHRHQFAMPDGSVVLTDLGGEHQHRGWEGSDYLWGGPHVHRLTLADGTVLETEISGEHEHRLQSESTLIDGPHCHSLVLPNGVTITSLDVGQEASGATPAPPAEDLFKNAVSVRGRAPAVWSMKKNGDVELRVSTHGAWCGWLLKSSGAKYIAIQLSYEDASWTPAIGEPGPDDIEHTAVDRGWVEQGYRDHDKLELFCEGARAGSLVFEARGTKIVASLEQDRAPLAYTLGVPGPVPSTLTKQVPSELRWWEATTRADANTRLVKARELGVLDCVGIVNGVWARMVKVTELRPALACPVDGGAVLTKAVPGLATISKRAGLAKSQNTGPVLLDATAGWTLRAAVGTAKSRPHTYVLAKDSFETRTALESLGYVYVLAADACDKIVGGSAPLDAPELKRVRAKALEPTAITRAWVLSAASTFDVDIDESWDGQVAADEIFEYAGWPDNPDPVKAGQCFLFRDNDTDVATNKGSFKDPIVRIIDGSPVVTRGALQAVSSRLPQTNVSETLKTRGRAVVDAYWEKIDEKLEAEGMERRATTKVRLVKAAQSEQTAKRLVYGVVMEPDEVDSYGDTQTAATIEKAAHGYLPYHSNVGIQHKFLINEYAQVVESYIAPQDLTFGEMVVKAGSWVMVMKILDESLWADIESGAIGGFSFGGYGQPVPV